MKIVLGPKRDDGYIWFAVDKEGNTKYSVPDQLQRKLEPHLVSTGKGFDRFNEDAIPQSISFRKGGTYCYIPRKGDPIVAFGESLDFLEYYMKEDSLRKDMVSDRDLLCY